MLLTIAQKNFILKSKCGKLSIIGENMKKHSISKLKYNLIANNTKEIIIFFQRNGLVIDCNKAAKDILEYGDDILKTYISDIFRDVVSSKDNRLIINSNFNNMTNETIAYKMDQTCISVDLKIILIEKHKKFLGLCIASDITLQKKLIGKVKHVRNDMKRLLKLKDVAVTNIIHELRTPVSGIMGMAEIILDTELNSEQSDNVNIIYENCKCMNALINGLFDIARIKDNKLVLKEKKFNPYLMIDKVIRVYRYSIKEKHLKLIVNISEDIPVYLIGDEFRLTQVIDNLLSNAIKFTHDGEIKLNVSMKVHNSHEVELLFMIIDTGIGIDAEDKDKIFMSYYQADGSITRSYGGVGLGLSICQMLVKAMGGRISVESTKGKGSAFLFSVCLKKETAYNEEILKATISNDTTDNIAMTKEYDFSIKENYSSMPVEDKTLVKMLMATIEKEDWQYAEQLALRVRELITDEDKIITNKMLQLLFSIRKEERELSIKRVEELYEIKNMHP